MSTGLYIHLPFCVKKCPYCGFHSVSNAADDIIAHYLHALLLELQSFNYPEIDTIYIGGGTPSHIGMRLPRFIESMLSLIRYSGAEFTVEVNPESVSAELCQALAKLPVNRISMGVQSLDDDVLRLLGRSHDSNQARQAYEWLRRFTTADINLDLIYDIPQVAVDSVMSSLGELLELAPEHISAYSYSPDTGYLATEPSHDPYQTELVNAKLQAADYLRYELSNYAKSGHLARHNLKYWQMQPYIGIGASAHSMSYGENNIHMRWQHAELEIYMQDPLQHSNIEQYSQEESLKEALVFGLRQLAGVNLAVLASRYRCYIPAELLDKIKTLTKQGLLAHEGEQVRATAKGLLLLNAVMEYLW